MTKGEFYVIENLGDLYAVQSSFPSQPEAEKEGNRLAKLFPALYFFVEYSEGEPVFINC